ncbi:methyltransferase domain-containing protein [Bacillaceae bacterium SIJ1]|uniref:class I SAM-dependent methyltransferase n=1 Tax=Litoribacterium kuwaitense TaxID=1398745 RepID=UPI0013EC0728|nr:methyltransferase domain-containing protein [Litoribacterium kuwaitense]NGP46136.1 methyltransferase domain-containing protein [Litoribacterium kuwaitense]
MLIIDRIYYCGGFNEKVAYDDYYQELNYFGNPYPGLIDFFTNYQPKGIALDLGCGQGRDSLFIGELGYKVIGIDHSSIGIGQLNEEAKKRNIDVEGIVDNVYDFPISKDIDIVLLDSMLHFYKNDLQRETEFVNKILTELKEGGVFVNCILKGYAREKTFKKIINESPYEWETLTDVYTEYSEANAEFHLLAIKKGKHIETSK